MMLKDFSLIIKFIIIVTCIYNVASCPVDEFRDAKAAYKSGEIKDSELPVTLDQIKVKLAKTGIFDWTDPTLTERERKELNKLFDAVEIVTTSRARQPSTVQNMFATLRTVERVVKKQLKEGQLSQSLAAKFHWDKLSTRLSRDGKEIYYLDKDSNRRKFNYQ